MVVNNNFIVLLLRIITITCHTPGRGSTTLIDFIIGSRLRADSLGTAAYRLMFLDVLQFLCGYIYKCICLFMYIHRLYIYTCIYNIHLYIHIYLYNIMFILYYIILFYFIFYYIYIILYLYNIIFI